MSNKVVLAFSGGLDMSYCVKYLKESLGYEVYSVIVNTGGFSPNELKEIERKAYSLGVKEHHCVDEVNNYYEKCLKYLIFGNVLKNNTYPLSVSAERVFQALAIAHFAKKIQAQAVAHGSTGAGNDQVRFDLVFNIVCPEMKIITPIRDMKLSREDEIKFLKEHGVEGDWEKALYSVNKGIWGTSVGGKETLTSDKYLAENAFPTQLSKENPETLEIEFQNGEPMGVNGQKFTNPVDAIHKIQELAAPFAIGRDIHVGDTIIGIKGRVGFEAAAPILIIKGHHALEKHTLTKWQLYWKDMLGTWYGNLLHEGQFLDPVMRNIEAFLTDTQKNVTGKVNLQLMPYRFHVIGIESPFDMMSSEFGKYGEMNNTWTAEDVKGFSKILGNQAMIWNKVNKKDL